jgi:hypothetical protein
VPQPFNGTYQGAPHCAKFLASDAFYIPSSAAPHARLLFHMFWVSVARGLRAAPCFVRT